MEVSRRSDYALRILCQLSQAQGAPVSVREIAEQQDIPYAFARSIQHDLALAGFISTVRGVHGGMLLAKDPKDFSVLDVLQAVQGPLGVSGCSRDETLCGRSISCNCHRVWCTADALLKDYLGSVSFKQLLGGD